MAGPWFATSVAPWAEGGGSSPDPVTAGDTGWTWDVEFSPVKTLLYARASLTSFLNFGGDSCWVNAGIVSYRTRRANGADKVHAVGQDDPDGLVPFIWDVNVDAVTFGWEIYGDHYTVGKFNLEIWI